MSKPRRSWILGVVPALLLAVLAIGTTDDAEGATTHTFSIPAAAFTPTDSAEHFVNNGHALYNNSVATDTAKTPLPILGDSAHITRVALHYYDAASGSICLELWRTRPKAATHKKMAKVCSKGAEGTNGSKGTINISPSYIGPEHGAYLAVTIPSGSSYGVYGATVTYTTP